MRARLSSIAILLLVLLIPLFFILEMIYKPFMISFLIKKLNPENIKEFLEQIEYLFEGFPWGGYFTLLGTMASVIWMRRAGENISTNFTLPVGQGVTVQAQAQTKMDTDNEEENPENMGK